MSRPQVTTDIGVLQGWPKKGGEKQTSASIAEALGITVFQITARLKGMEERGFLQRDRKFWIRSEVGLREAKNPSPSVVGTGKRQLNSVGAAAGPPDDTHVPLVHVPRDRWAPSDSAVAHARRRLPEIKDRLVELRASDQTKETRRGIMALRVEYDHLKELLAKKRDGCWTLRRIKSGSHVFDLYVSPDGREYVKAEPHEIADMRIKSPSGFDPARLRLFTTSAASKKVARAQREVEGRKAAAKERRNNDGETNGQEAPAGRAVDRSKAEAEEQERIRQETLQAARWAKKHPNGAKSFGVKISKQEAQQLIKAGKQAKRARPASHKSKR